MGGPRRLNSAGSVNVNLRSNTYFVAGIRQTSASAALRQQSVVMQYWRVIVSRGIVFSAILVCAVPAAINTSPSKL